MFYVLHSKCVNLGSRSFGPWCSKVTARRAKNGGVSPSKSCKDNPPGGSREKTVTDRLWQNGAGRMASIRGKPRRNGGGRDIVNLIGDKNTKTTDVFDRLSGQGAPYAFQHFADVTQYMSEYREQHTVGRVCRRMKKVPVMGVDVPDPYTCRKKRTCLCSDCSPLAKTKMAVSTQDGAAVVSESSPSGKDSSSKHVPTRAVPNLAPVREKKATDTGSHGTKVTTSSDQQSAYVSRHSSSDHAPFPSLVLPTIHIQRDTKHMTVIGQSPPMENPLTRSTEYTSSNPEESTSKPKHSDGDIGSSRKEGKKATARLKYSKRSVVPESSVRRREVQTTPPDHLHASHSAGRNPDNSAAHSEATSDKPSASKIQTGTAEDSVCERELRLPRIVSKELAGEAESKRGGRSQNRSFYTTFTQVQKIYANKHDPAGHGDRDAVSHGEGTRGAHLGNIYGDLRSFGGNIRVYVGSKRSRSVEVFPRNRVRARKEAPHSSGNNSKKSEALSVRVMSEDDLTTELRHEDTNVHHLADFRQLGDSLLPTVADSSLKLWSGPTDGENKVVFFLPDTEGQAYNQAIIGAKRTTKKDITLANSLTREKSKGINEPASQQSKYSNASTIETSKQQKEFVSRTQREKSTYFNISRKNTVISHSGNQTETIGIRGRTITENTSVSNGHGTNKPAQDKTFNSSDTIYRTPRADQDNEPETASPRFAGKFVGRQPTFVLPPDKYGVSTCTVKTGTWTSPASNVYRGSLLVQGGILDGDLTTRTDQRDVETSATLPVKVEYRLPKDSAPSLDDSIEMSERLLS
ncbi:hypothetical protein V1264_021221 [Littorina saxatilis]|uniref:Uncharacterized protein n=1 Tax=Littorina saxatilis TaxID=31220 RepID=A0AAN9AHS9_9CAEN